VEQSAEIRSESDHSLQEVKSEFVNKKTFLETIKDLEERIDKNEKERETYEESIRSFSELTRELQNVFSIKGYSKILKTDILLKKLLCLVFIIALFVLCIIFVNNNLQDYRGHKVTTEVARETNETLRFPAITVCAIELNQSVSFDPVSIELTDRLLADCSFTESDRKENCTLADFNNFNVTNPITSEYFNCYQINGGLNAANGRNKVYESLRFGTQSGLMLSFNLEENQFITYYVGEARTRPIYSEMTSMLQPGKFAFVHFELMSDTKQPKPYTECTEEINAATSHLVKQILDQNLIYRQIYCLDLLAYQQKEELCPLECVSVSFDIKVNEFKFFDPRKNKSLVVNFFYPNGRFTELKQSVKTSTADAIANTGALVGLFLELTFVSAYRFMGFFIDILL